MSQHEQAIRHYINQHHQPNEFINNIMNSENIHLHGSNAQSFYNHNTQTNDSDLEDFKNKVKI